MKFKLNYNTSSDYLLFDFLFIAKYTYITKYLTI